MRRLPNQAAPPGAIKVRWQPSGPRPSAPRLVLIRLAHVLGYDSLQMDAAIAEELITAVVCGVAVPPAVRVAVDLHHGHPSPTNDHVVDLDDTAIHQE